MNVVTLRTRRREHREQFPGPRIAIDATSVALGAVILGVACLVAQGQGIG